MVGLLEDLVGGLGPHERVGALVPALDEAAEFGVEVLDGLEDAAADGLAFDDTATRGSTPSLRTQGYLSTTPAMTWCIGSRSQARSSKQGPSCPATPLGSKLCSAPAGRLRSGPWQITNRRNSVKRHLLLDVLRHPSSPPCRPSPGTSPMVRCLARLIPGARRDARRPGQGDEIAVGERDRDCRDTTGRTNLFHFMRTPVDDADRADHSREWSCSEVPARRGVFVEHRTPPANRAVRGSRRARSAECDPDTVRAS